VINPADHIDAYMKGALKNADLAAFEEALTQDASLQELVDNYENIGALSEGILELELLKEIEKVGDGDSPSESPASTIKDKPGPLWIYLIIGVVLLTLSYYFFSNKKTIPPPIDEEDVKKEILYAYYERPEFEGNLRSIGADELEKLDDFEKGKYYFELNEFAKSEEVLKNVIAQTQDVDTLSSVNFWLGNSALLDERYEEAHGYFARSADERALCYGSLARAILAGDRGLVDKGCGK